MSTYQTDSLFRTEAETKPCRHIIRVAFDAGVDSEFDYLVADELWPILAGQRVEVPFGKSNRPKIGFCVHADVPSGQSYAGKAHQRRLKRVARIVGEQPLVDEQLMQLARWISSYYVCPLGQTLAAMVPAAVKKGIGLRKQKVLYLADDARPGDSEPKGPRQRQIAEYLRNHRAVDRKSALNLKEVIQTIGCTEAPVKRLAEKRIVRIAQKSILTSLPAVPTDLRLQNHRVLLNDDQNKALRYLTGQIDSGRFGVTLLYGVTDSGKTEVYIRAIEQVIKKGKSAIVLLPEISLTAQTVQRFGRRLEKLAVLHSGLTGAQRHEQWRKIKAGQARVVIGARSAVFAPVSNLGLIVVDEEHESSYKQDTVPRYHGRDVAIKRTQLCNAHCLLGSATPSLESLSNCRNKPHFHLVSLPERVMDLPMPKMRLIDLREDFFTSRKIRLISQPLADAIKDALAQKQQAILMLNRRGYSRFVLCPSCKHMLHCRNCDVTLTFHKSHRRSNQPLSTITGKHLDYGYAMCHYCGAKSLVPRDCPVCGKKMIMVGLGSQRLEEELRAKFPDARVARVDSDAMRSRDYYRLLSDFSRRRIDILAGTQILAKGLHFPNVTVVGIINADTSLFLPDFRSNERTFQLISQVAGRTGRSKKKGIVFVQTFFPEQLAIRLALQNDYNSFVEKELEHRRNCKLPPVWRLAIMTLRDRKYEKLESLCKTVRESVDTVVKQQGLAVKVRGPLPAPLSRIQRFHRMQILIQAPKAELIQRLFKQLRRQRLLRTATQIAVDIDPVGLL